MDYEGRDRLFPRWFCWMAYRVGFLPTAMLTAIGLAGMAIGLAGVLNG